MIAAVEVERIVRERASGRCESCRMHQSLQGATFHLEHIYPLSRGGRIELENPAIACPSCNLAESNRPSAEDPLTGTATSLFHLRQDSWASHFRFAGMDLVGLTPVGRTTVAAFHLNDSRRQEIRKAESLLGLFPPPSDEPRVPHGT